MGVLGGVGALLLSFSSNSILLKVVDRGEVDFDPVLSLDLSFFPSLDLPLFPSLPRPLPLPPLPLPLVISLPLDFDLSLNFWRAPWASVE